MPANAQLDKRHWAAASVACRQQRDSPKGGNVDGLRSSIQDVFDKRGLFHVRRVLDKAKKWHKLQEIAK